MGETLVIGVAGGAAGIALGYAAPRWCQVRGAAVGDARPAPDRRPPVRAPGGGRSAAAARGGFRRLANDASKTILVHLNAPVTVGVIVLAVLLAVAGGLSLARSAAGGPRGCGPLPPSRKSSNGHYAPVARDTAGP